MWWAVKQLCVPLNYLRIRDGEGVFQSKRFYDFVLPVVLAVATFAYFCWFSISYSLFDHPVLTQRVSQLLSLMIVFFLAALAAVSTFARKGIDETVKDEPLMLRVRADNPTPGKEWVDKELTYRHFISYLFGYLSFLSLLLFIFVIVGETAWKGLVHHYQTNPRVHGFLTEIIDPILLIVFVAALWHLIVTALLGIYFLTERIQNLGDGS